MLDYSSGLKGHMVLFAKGHYKDMTLDQFYQKFCGLPEDYRPHARSIMELQAEILHEAAVHTKQDRLQRDVIETLLRKAAEKNNRLTSYQVTRETDIISIQDIIDSYMSSIMMLQVYDPDKKEHIIKLPEVKK